MDTILAHTIGDRNRSPHPNILVHFQILAHPRIPNILVQNPNLGPSSNPGHPGSKPKSWSILSSRTLSCVEGHPGSI
ncbi:hypothetical protein [Sphingobacterium sp.]|uniref:hypothetical protein n=1 Tax=Sphingobacterium sp. TaxID=341027 RepID=UPI0028AB4023|nr:hypothetical protein [Sphingobacterium sp.]